jgi:hypothetical protein
MDCIPKRRATTRVDVYDLSEPGAVVLNSADNVNDPNGIRTRVTAVKGRCPRPLDDRVKKLCNIGIAIVRRKANWQEVLRTPKWCVVTHGIPVRKPA